MKPSRTIKYKALFLLVTFSLNSVVGFACSLGVDMGFNSGHHEHNDQEQHKRSQKGHTESHRNDHEPADDNCCNDLVADFQNLDKAIVKGNSNVQQPHILLSPFIIPVALGLNNTKGFTKHFQIPPKETDLPPPNIIVFIQSFLI